MLSTLESSLQERSLKVILDGQSSPLYITNAGVRQGSVLEPTLFLVFIMIFLMRFYQEQGSMQMTPLYSSLGKSVFYDKMESAGELEIDLCSIV